jgi:hypothetical protein
MSPVGPDSTHTTTSRGEEQGGEHTRRRRVPCDGSNRRVRLDADGRDESENEASDRREPAVHSQKFNETEERHTNATASIENDNLFFNNVIKFIQKR